MILLSIVYNKMEKKNTVGTIPTTGVGTIEGC
jgi:hypothetical protein